MVLVPDHYHVFDENGSFFVSSELLDAVVSMHQTTSLEEKTCNLRDPNQISDPLEVWLW